MLSVQSHICRTLAALSLLTLLSCSTYNRQAASYYTNLQGGDYEKASSSLDKIKLLKKDRNHLLYLLEKGRVLHLLQQYDSSNRYFNEADQIIESARTSAKDIVLGSLLNPMMQTYKAEDFEKYLLHYYKALNYVLIGRPDEALVEAKRITLRSNTQIDKVKKNKYAEDAFSFILQGMIFEKNDDVNNAFIAYRNAADVYLDNSGTYYGIEMPLQLKKDLLRTAHLNGFIDELQRYQKLLNYTFAKDTKHDGGELIVFWENGFAPVKEQQDFFFALQKGAGGSFFFVDQFNAFNIPFDFSSGYQQKDISLTDLRSLRVAFPKYREQPIFYSNASLLNSETSFSFEPVESINQLAFSTLKERTIKELSSTLTRLAIKKLAEVALRASKKEEPKTEKEKKQQDTRDALALGLQVFNFASEKADTRNWQGLPHTISYCRIPLKKGNNMLSLKMNGVTPKTISLSVNGNGQLQFRNVSTLR